MKKELCLLLCVAVLGSFLNFGAVFAESGTALAPGVTIGKPSGKNVLITYTTEDGFYKKQGETPWGFEHAPVGTDTYEPLEFIENGWYYENYQNWSQGAVQHPISMHAGTLADPIVSFTAPSDGQLLIHEAVVDDLGEQSDGAQVCITKNNKNVYPAEGFAKLYYNKPITLPALVFDVKKGDVIRFRLNCIENQTMDGIHWTKKISYLGDSAAAKPVEGVTFGMPEDMTIVATHTTEDGFAKKPGETPWGFEHAMVNTDNYEPLEFVQNGWYYESYQNWTQGAVQHPISMHAGMIADPIVSFKAPQKGTLMIHAAKVEDLAEVSDGVQFKIMKNDQQLYPTMGWAQNSFGEVTEIPDLAFEVEKGDVIRFRLNCLSTQYGDGIHWTKTLSYLAPATEIVPGAGVNTTIPQGTVFEGRTEANDAFNSNEGTDWVYENAAVGANQYSPLERLSSADGTSTGWFTGTYQNWAAGAIPYPGYMHPGMSGDTSFTYVVPKDGTLAILETTIKVDADSYDGAKIGILKKDTPIYPSVGLLAIKPGKSSTIPNMTFAVKAGDRIHFRGNCNASQQAESIRWNPVVAYVNEQQSGEKPAVFIDLTNHWAREAVENLYQRNIVVGKGEGIFDPEAPVTRAEFLTMVQKAAKIPTVEYKDYYPDVPMQAWFTNVINAAYAYDLIADEMTPDGKFYPDAPLLREEATSVMVNTMQYQEFTPMGSGDLSRFTDALSCAEWVRPFIATAVERGLIMGNPDGTFAPKNTITRAESAVILNRFLGATETETHVEGTVSATYGAPLYKQVDIDKLIQDAYKSGAKEVTLPAGVYQIPYRNGKHIKLENMKDFAIRGQNTTLVFEHTNATGIAISGCDNLTISGINTDHAGYGFYQGVITAVDPEYRYIDIQLDPAYPHFFMDRNEFYADINARFYTPDGQLLLNIDDRGQLASYDKTGQYRYRCYLRNNDSGKLLKAGYLIGERSKIGTNIGITGSGAIHMKDCKVYTGITGISEMNGEGGSTYTDVHLIPGPKPAGAQYERLFSITGTGYYSGRVRKGAVLDRVRVVKNNDDGLNVHSYYAHVAEQIDPKTVVVATEDNVAVWFAVGDEMRFADTDNKQVGTAKITASEKLSGYQPPVDLNYKDKFVSFTPNHYYKLTLDKAVSVEAKYIADDASLASNGFTVRNSYFAYNAPRAMIMHAYNAVIENNTFENVPRYAIYFRPEVDWGEAGYTQNAVIRNNTFKNCGYSMDTAAAIGFVGDGGYDHSGNTIEGNTFIGSYRSDIRIECASDLVIKNNTFGAPTALYGETPAVVLNKVDGVTFEGNTFVNETRKVQLGQLVTDVKGL